MLPKSAHPGAISAMREIDNAEDNDGIRSRKCMRHQLNGLLVFVFYLAITSGGTLFVLHHFDPTIGKVVELPVLVVANLVATLIRFVALRRVFSA